MNDKSDLLGQLKIDRDSSPAPARKWPWIAGAAALAGAAAAAYLLLKPDAALPVTLVSAYAPSAGGSGSPPAAA